MSDNDLTDAVEDILENDAEGCVVRLSCLEAAEVCGAIREELYRTKPGEAANSVADLREALSRIDLLMGGDGDVERMLRERAEMDEERTDAG